MLVKAVVDILREVVNPVRAVRISGAYLQHAGALHLRKLRLGKLADAVKDLQRVGVTLCVIRVVGYGLVVLIDERHDTLRAAEHLTIQRDCLERAEIEKVLFLSGANEIAESALKVMHAMPVVGVRVPHLCAGDACGCVVPDSVVRLLNLVPCQHDSLIRRHDHHALIAVPVDIKKPSGIAAHGSELCNFKVYIVHIIPRDKFGKRLFRRFNGSLSAGRALRALILCVAVGRGFSGKIADHHIIDFAEEVIIDFIIQLRDCIAAAVLQPIGEARNARKDRHFVLVAFIPLV